MVTAGPLEAGDHLNISEKTGSVWEPKDLGKHSTNGPFVSIAFLQAHFGDLPTCEGQLCNLPLSLNKLERSKDPQLEIQTLAGCSSDGLRASQPADSLLRTAYVWGPSEEARGSVSNCVSHALVG